MGERCDPLRYMIMIPDANAHWWIPLKCIIFFFSFIVASVEKVEDTRIKHSLQIMLRTYFYFNLLAVVSRILR